MVLQFSDTSKTVNITEDADLSYEILAVRLAKFFIGLDALCVLVLFL